MIRFGLYGCNMYRTRELVEGAQAACPGQFAIVACYDIDQQKALTVAERLGGVAYDTEAAFLAHDMDVVLIALPPYLHPAAFTAAARAGKDVYLEKPVCVDDAGRQLVLEAANRYGVRCYVGLSQRYNIPFRKVAEIATSPEAGRLLAVHHHWLAPGRPFVPETERGWRDRLEQSGGQLIFHCCHILDWFRWMGGEVQAVSASAYTHPGAALPHEEQELSACFTYDSGALAVFNLSQHSHQYVQYGTVHTENLSVTYEWGVNTHVKVYRNRPRAADETFEWSLTNAPGDGGDRDILQLRDFMTAYSEERPMPVSLVDGIRVYDMASAVRDSYRTGQRVTLPPLPELSVR
jgi:predicted dehydrogenase